MVVRLGENKSWLRLGDKKPWLEGWVSRKSCGCKVG